MIRLVRTATMGGDWEKVDTAVDALEKLYADKYPQVKSVEHWYAISGPINKIQTELTFDSLAKEEEWVKGVMKDDVYRQNMQILVENLSDIRDDLYRRWEG
jgi:hypothetical protein